MHMQARYQLVIAPCPADIPSLHGHRLHDSNARESRDSHVHLRIQTSSRKHLLRPSQEPMATVLSFQSAELYHMHATHMGARRHKRKNVTPSRKHLLRPSQEPMATVLSFQSAELYHMHATHMGASRHKRKKVTRFNLHVEPK